MRRIGIATWALLIGACTFGTRPPDLAADTGPSKQAESDSIRTAHREFERRTGLTERQQYDSYRCEVWFYDSLGDRSNFGKLTEADRKDLKATVGGGPFFLHRFTPKKAGGRVHEVFVSKDGTAVLGARAKPAEGKGDDRRD